MRATIQKIIHYEMMLDDLSMNYLQHKATMSEQEKVEIMNAMAKIEETIAKLRTTLIIIKKVANK
jgi:hypothetical protein